jgi:ribA/ribD-fused uncharacterized protein
LVLCGLLRFGFARHISTAFRRHSDRGGLRYLDAILMNTSLLRQVAQTFLAEYEEQENVDWSPEWRALAELARSALAAPANCCEIAVAIASKYVLENVKQVEAIGGRLSAGPFANGWSTACDEIIERLCDPSAPTARPAPADSALREVATTFLAAYEEQEDADWSPEWRALAERARHALSPVERGGEGRWFDPMSPKFDPGRVLVGLRPSKPVAPSPAAESDGRVGCAVCAMCGELLRAEYQLGPAQFGVGQRITPAEQMPVAWIGDAGLTLLEVQGRAMIFRSELKGSGNNERPLYFHPAPPAPSAGVSVSEGECHGLDTPERVCFYEQDFYPLSNFSAFSLLWDGKRFDTSEAAYHYEKFPGNQRLRTLIRVAPSAHAAFKLAEREKGKVRPDWKAVRLDVMRRIIREKTTQHEYVRRKLLATGNRLLVENSWRDNFWGEGPDGDGENWLGRLWMEHRDELTAAAQVRANDSGVGK